VQAPGWCPARIPLPDESASPLREILWEFAFYMHSRHRYDPDEWFFPGTDEVDGTVEGALRAGLAAYPE
jgi:hypothetical protein